MDLYFELVYNIYILVIAVCSVYLFYTSLFIILKSKNRLFIELDENKQKYVIKNISKSLILALVSYILVYLLIDVCINKQLNNSIKSIASVYVANDIIGLFWVPNLSTTTKQHHITTTVLLFLNYFIDYSNFDNITTKIGILLIGYTTMSAYAFIVNFYLGSRFIIENRYKNINYLLNYVAYYNYKICLAINWVSQALFMLYTLYYELSLLYIYVPYLAILIPIITDDIVLVAWLKNHLEKF